MAEATQPSPGEPGYEHERPALGLQGCKPDVLQRLQARLDWWRDSEISESDDARTTEMDAGHDELLVDAIDAIEGLRDSGARRLREINRLKGVVAELKAAANG